MTTYTVFGQSGFAGSNSATTGARTIGMQFSLSQSATLQAAWMYSNTGLTHLPSGIVLWDMDTGTAVESVLAASWSGAAGSGWVRAAFAGTTTLSSAVNYGISFTDSGPGVPYYADANPYAAFQSGGITSGIITVPDTSHAAHGQAPFSTTYDTFPSSTSSGINFWVDVEVSTSGGTAHTATASLTVTPSSAAVQARGTYRTASLAVTPSRAAIRTRGTYRTSALAVSPSLVAARARSTYRAASLAAVPSLSAARLLAHVRAASLAVAPARSASAAAARVRQAALTATPRLTAVPSGGAATGAVLGTGDARLRWTAGGARNQ